MIDSRPIEYLRLISVTCWRNLKESERCEVGEEEDECGEKEIYHHNVFEEKRSRNRIERQYFGR